MNQLTGFRFLLSFQILLFHTMPVAYLTPRLQYLNRFGSVSTSLFIILSGYALAYVYSKRTINYKQFIYRRFLKLYPLHLFMILVSTVLILDIFLRGKYGISNVQVNSMYHFASTREFLVSIFSQVFIVDSWNPFYLGINIPGWTLSCLLSCYLLFPWLLKKSVKYGKQELLWGLLMLWGLILILPTLILLFGYNDAFMQHTTQLYSFPSFLYGLLHRNPIIRLPEFVIGIVIFRLSEKVQTGNSSLKIYGLTLIIISIMCLARTRVSFAFMHNGFFIPLEICALWILITRENFLTRFLSGKKMVFLGNMSFSMYLIHMPLYFLWSRIDGAVYSLSNFGRSDFFSDAKHLPVNQLAQRNSPHIASYLLFLISTIAISLIVQKHLVNAIYEKHKTSPVRLALD